jgi:hypothetical protein
MTSVIRGYSQRIQVDVQTDIDVSSVQIGNPIDAFGRLRTSNPYTLYDFTSIYGKNPLYFNEEIAEGGQSLHNPASYILMNVSRNGDSVIRQTKEYIPYQPGKSRLVYMTGVLIDSTDEANQDVISRMGCFDGSGGYFLEYDGGVISLVERDNTTEHVIVRDDWIDPLDGTGSSGKSIDFTDAQILAIDQEWLGVGQVRIGFVIEGQIYYCHKFTHSGTSAVRQPYFKMAKLPLRYEITSSGSANSMRMICGTVISEGGYNNIGTTFNEISDGGFSLTNSAYRPVFSLSLRADGAGVIPYERTTIKIKGIDLFNVNNNYGAWKLLLNATISDTSSSFQNYDSVNSSARVRHHSTSATYSGGFILDSGFFAGRLNEKLITSVDEIVTAIPLSSSIDGQTQDVITLIAKEVGSGGGSPVMVYSFSWIEIR